MPTNFNVLSGAGRSLQDTASSDPTADLSDSLSLEWDQELHGDSHAGTEAIRMRSLQPSASRNVLAGEALEENPPLSPSYRDIESSDPDLSISEVKAADVPSQAQSLRDSIITYGSDRNGSLVEPPSYVREVINASGGKQDPTSWHAETWSSWPGQAREWNDRIERSVRLTNMISDLGSASSEEAPALAAKWKGQTVAMETLEQSDGKTEVSSLVAHPGVTGSGKAMVDQVVKASRNAGHGGVVEVTSIASSEGFYSALGFRPIGRDLYKRSRMSLDPSGSLLDEKKRDLDQGRGLYSQNLTTDTPVNRQYDPRDRRQERSSSRGR